MPHLVNPRIPHPASIAIGDLQIADAKALAGTFGLSTKRKYDSHRFTLFWRGRYYYSCFTTVYITSSLKKYILKYLLPGMAITIGK